jgi:hypothetical protein
MSRGNDRRSNDDMHDQLQAMQRALEGGSEIPGLDRLLWLLALPEDNRSHVTPSGLARGDESEEDAMLAEMISEAMNGVDIARRYPRFFRRMLLDPSLRAAFLDGLEALELGRVASDDVLPRAPSRDLSFLKRAPGPETTVDPNPGTGYLARWTRAARDLGNLLSFALPSSMNPLIMAEPLPVYRSDDDALQDQAATLLQGRISGNNIEVDVTLEGARNAAQPDELQLTLWVLSVKEDQPLPTDLALVAHVEWGDYHQVVVLNGEGRYPLPPRKIRHLSDASGNMSDDLHITINHRQ